MGEGRVVHTAQYEAEPVGIPEVKSEVSELRFTVSQGCP